MPGVWRRLDKLPSQPGRGIEDRCYGLDGTQVARMICLEEASAKLVIVHADRSRTCGRDLAGGFATTGFRCALL
jgi:hypothetical protein